MPDNSPHNMISGLYRVQRSHLYKMKNNWITEWLSSRQFPRAPCKTICKRDKQTNTNCGNNSCHHFNLCHKSNYRVPSREDYCSIALFELRQQVHMSLMLKFFTVKWISNAANWTIISKHCMFRALKSENTTIEGGNLCQLQYFNLK